MSSSPPDNEWVAVTVVAPPELVDAVSDFCVDHQSQGVVVDDADSDSVRLTAYFRIGPWESVKKDLDALSTRLGSLFPELPRLSFETSPLKQENWAVAWKDSFTSLTVGDRFAVTPPWILPEFPGRHIIVIDPGEAFGTGTHETTQGCLELLESAANEMALWGGQFSLLDVGCGSGILAIAGVKLGAARAVAVDNDPIALENAVKNARLNGVEASLVPVCTSLAAIEEGADIVTANLDTRTLLESGARLVALANCFLIVSGVPLDRWAKVKEALQEAGCRLTREMTRSEWGCGLFETRPAPIP